MIKNFLIKHDYIPLICSLLGLFSVLYFVIYPEWHQYEDTQATSEKFQIALTHTETAIYQFCQSYVSDSDKEYIHTPKLDLMCSKYKH
jgi:hypothetical protein